MRMSFLWGASMKAATKCENEATKSEFNKILSKSHISTNVNRFLNNEQLPFLQEPHVKTQNSVAIRPDVT